MTNRQYFVKSIAYSLGLLFLIAVLTVIIDPFVHYHAPFFGLAAAETEERGQQIGVAKNMHYDTAIVGSSMSENFEAGWPSVIPSLLESESVSGHATYPHRIFEEKIVTPL